MPKRDDVTVMSELSHKRRVWIDAINAGQPGAFVSVVAEDAVWLPWGPTAIEGRDRIRSWVAAAFAEFSYDYEVADIHVRIAGDWAVERARFRTRALNEAGSESPEHVGEYTVLWRRAESVGWLIDRYVDHTELDAA